MGSRKGTLALACLAALVAASPAAAAPTSILPRGTILVGEAPSFPIVLSRGPALDGTTPWGGGALDEVAAWGVTVLTAGPNGQTWSDEVVAETRAMTDAAAARGLHTIVNLRELARTVPGTPEEVRLREVVEALRGSPGLGFWKGADEPWHNRWPVDLLQPAHSITKALDPAHLFVTIQAPRGLPIDLVPYNAVTDVHGVDVYPVRWIRPNPYLHWVGRWTNTMARITPSRAAWTTLGVCASGSFDRVGGSGAFVMPTKVQMRYMAYDAILNGARGLAFFGGQNRGCLRPEDVPFDWNWTFWRDVLRPIVYELGPRGRLHPALVAPGTGIGVRSSDSLTQVQSRLVGRELWVLAARRGAGTRTVRLRGLPRTVRRAWVYREGRSVPVRNGVITDRFGRWDVNVYRLILPPERD